MPARGEAAPVPAAPASSRGSSVETWAVTRRVYPDNLKVALIAGVIVVHSLLGYFPGDLWPYANVHEVELSLLTVAVVMAVAAPFGMFLMALLFLVAGLLTPAALERKGPGRFTRDRLIRLGVPFVVFTQLVWPVLLYALYRPLGLVQDSYWAETYHQLSWRALWRGEYPDSGPLWFVGVLLVFSLAYAGWVALRPTDGPRRPPGRITVRRLLLLAVAVAVASFPIRLVYPYGGPALFDLNEWQWPECAALFAVGIAGARQGWLSALPEQLTRTARRITALAVLGTVVLVASLSVTGADYDQALGGWHRAALAFVLLEGLLTVFGSVWLLSVAQRHLDRRFRLGPALACGSYSAFLLHAPVLVGFAVAMRPIPVAAEVKALTLAVTGAVSSFALAWRLLTRVRLLGRLL